MKKILKAISESSFLSRTTPRFWHDKGFLPQLLVPFSVVYFLLKHIIEPKSKPQKFDLKVICVGNATVGGAGKTPTAIAIYNELKKLKPSAKISFVSTGFKAKLRGPIEVNPNAHNSADVGDEALLLASHGTTIICKDRVEALKFAASSGIEYAILDDGLHDKRIQKDITFLVIDGKYGFGNGLLLPAGPMRDRLDYAVEGTDYIILIGNDEKLALKQIKYATKKQHPVVKSFIDSITNIDEMQVYVAFAGIGRPQKFFDMLKYEMKLVVAETVEFADHHPYGKSDLETLENIAKSQKAKLITTEKDFVKLPKDFAANVDCLKIELKFEDESIQEILRKI